MGHPATRREMRQRQKRGKGMRVLAPFLAAGIVASLTLGSTSMAMATDAPVADEAATTVQVETTPIQEEVAPAPEAVEADAADTAEAPADPAPVEDVKSEPVAQEPAVEEPAEEQPAPEQATSEQPAESAKQVAPATKTGGEQPFDWNWQYAAPTCDGLTVSYPNNIPAGSDNKDVNIRVKNLVTGEVKTFNFHDSDYTTSGKTVTYQVTAHADWQNWEYYEVQWTQVHGTNYHWEGSIICGTDPPAEPECVQNPTWSYTFDGVGSGTVTASSATRTDRDLKLCDPLAVRAITYAYDRPASGNPSWPQTLVGYNDVLVDTVGTFSYSAPALDKCRQHDIAAEFVSNGGFDALAVSETLNGPNDPFEPPFLHATLSGKGPNPTWSTTSSDGCNPPVDEPEVVTGAGEFQTLSCTEGSKNWAELDGVPDGVWTFTDKNGATYKTANGVAYSGGVPGGLAYGTMTVSLALTDDNPSGDYVVTPQSYTWTPVDPKSLDCNVDEPETVTGTAKFETLSCTEGSKNWAETDVVPGGVWIFIDENEERYVTENGEGYTGGIPEDLVYGDISVELVDGDSTDNYEVTYWSGTWKTVDPASLDCNVDEPETVTGTAKFETLTCVVGTKNWAATDEVPGGEWVFTDKNGDEYVTAAGEGYVGDVPEGLAYGTITVTLSDADATDNYEVTPWDGTWKAVDPSSLDCGAIIVPPTDNPPSNPPVVVNPPNNPPVDTPDSLAVTGTDGEALNGFLGMAALFLLAGTALVITRRRRSVNQGL